MRLRWLPLRFRIGKIYYSFHVHTLQSGLTGKRPMSYVDDDDSDIEGGGEEVSFTGTSRSKKAKVSDTKIDMVDVSSTMSSASLVT